MPDNKIIEYGICSANDTQELVLYVDKELKNGYQPYGFVFTSLKGEMLFYHQAMVKISSARTAISKTVKIKQIGKPLKSLPVKKKVKNF